VFQLGRAIFASDDLLLMQLLCQNWHNWYFRVFSAITGLFWAVPRGKHWPRAVISMYHCAKTDCAYTEFRNQVD